MIRLSTIDRFGALPDAGPVLGDVRDARGGWRRADERFATSTPPTLALPGARAAGPVMTWASSVWPLPATPAMPTISPARTSSDDAAQGRQAAVAVGLDARRRTARTGPGWNGVRSSRSRTVPADHQAGEARPWSRRRPGCPAAVTLPRRMTVIRSAMASTSAELVADEDDAPAGVGHRSQGPEELVHLLRRQHGRRLVHDQDPRAAVEHLEDLDPLLLADRELPDLGPRVDPQPECARPGRRSPRRSAGPQQEARRSQAEQHVLGHRLRRDQREVLVDHPDARPRSRRAATRTSTGSPSTPDLPASGRYRPDRMFMSVLLPAPFSPRRAWISPVPEVEVDIVVGDDAGEGLDDAAPPPGRERRRPRAASAWPAAGAGVVIRSVPCGGRSRPATVGRGPSTGSGQESGGNSAVMPSVHQYMHVLHSEPGAPGGNWSRSDCSSLLAGRQQLLAGVVVDRAGEHVEPTELAGQHLRERGP